MPAHRGSVSYICLILNANKVSTMNRLILLLFLVGLQLPAFAQPSPCAGNPAMASTCLDACVICDIDGFTGRNNLTAQGQTFPNFCTTTFHNMSYIAFIAGSVDLEIAVTVTNCTINWGLEIGFFESSDCQTFTSVTDCNTDVAPNTTVSFTNDIPLTIGAYYYLIMDGSNSDICDWTFNVISGTTAVPPIGPTGVISVETESTCPELPAIFSVTDTPSAALFYWTVNGVPHSNLQQTTDITFPADGTYEVCVAAANACDEAAPNCVTYLVRTPETLSLDEVLCDNDCLEIADTVLCETGEYEFHITLENGCDSAIFVSLEILPQAQAFIDINMCAEDTFFVGNIPYYQTGISIDTIATAMDCDSIITLDLFIVECIIEAETGFLEPVCTGESNGFLTFSVENGTPPFTYIWAHITDPTINGNGSTLLFDNNTIANVPAGDYTIEIFDTFGNQTVEFQSVFDPPVLSVAVDPIDIDDYHLSCFGGADGRIWGFPMGGVPPYTYSWSSGGVADSIVGLSAGNYVLSLTDANGCEVTAETELTEPPVIQPFVNFIDPNCDGYDTGIIHRDSVNGGSPPFLYSMDNDSFGLFFTFNDLNPGDYTFYVMDDNGCLVDTTATLGIPDIPEIIFDSDLEVNLGCDITIPTLTNNTTLTEIQWTPNSFINCDSCLRPKVNPVNETEYILTVTSIDGCVDTDSINVFVIKDRDVYFPTAFSPNGDGINDVFSVYPGKSVGNVNFLKVYNRWGAQVYEAFDLPSGNNRVGWNGDFKGKRMDGGVYTWIAEVTYLDGFTLFYRGDVSIVF
ncbi:MAG: gliding motility-associated-like protein [Polaribacter sp.]